MKTPQLTPKEKKALEARFEKIDKDPHTDYKIIAFELAKDYKRLLKKCEKLEKQNVVKNEEMKEDRKTVYDTVCELSEYIEDTENEFLEKEKIFGYIATIQNYSNN